MNKSNSSLPPASSVSMNRRRFLKATAIASTITILPGHVMGGPGQTPPSEKVNIAGIGVGGMGGANVQALASQNIVALCDVDHDNAAHTFKEYPNAKLYTDRSVFIGPKCPKCQQAGLVELVSYVCPKDNHTTICGRTDERQGAPVCEACHHLNGRLRQITLNYCRLRQF